MKTSYKKIQLFAVATNKYLDSHKDETKLAYALKKVAPRVNKVIQEEYPEAVERINIINANTDANKSILYTEVLEADGSTSQKYQFTPEGLLSQRAAIKELFSDEIFDVEPFIINELPPDFNEEYRTYFENFVLAPQELKSDD